ncbi:MAG: hypothetical protein AAB626_03285 [Patescibacteria group bacterium]
MKITKEDPNLMVIKDRNIFVFLIGAVFALAGFLVILKPDFFTEQPPTWFGFMFFIIGLLTLFQAGVVTVSLDKTSNKLLFLRKKLIGKSNQSEYALNQIKEVELSVAYNKSGYSYHLSFIFNNGEIVPLSPGASSIIKINGWQIVPENDLGTKISNFLNIPFQERRAPTVGETLSAIQSAVQTEMEKQKKE